MHQCCRGNKNLVLEVWEPDVGNWRLHVAHRLVWFARADCPVILMRPSSGVELCAGLGQELGMIEAAAGLEEPSPATSHDLRDGDVDRRKSLRILAWSAVSCPYPYRSPAGIMLTTSLLSGRRNLSRSRST